MPRPTAGNSPGEARGASAPDKPASTRAPIHELLAHRWSPRAFATRPVERAKLLSLFEAARWAPSSFNDQPWFFLLATRDDTAQFDRLLACLTEGNRAWARQAAVLLLAVARLHFARDGRANRHAFYDVGQAAAHLTFEAATLGLAVHQMAGVDREKARVAFGIPDGYETAAAIAIGYPGDPDSLPEGLRERERAPRERKPLPSFVFAGHWGEPAGVLEA
jgi:nitroreductase